MKCDRCDTECSDLKSMQTFNFCKNRDAHDATPPTRAGEASQVKSFCCEVCWRNPTCGNDCGSCDVADQVVADVCHRCHGLGRVYTTEGVADCPCARRRLCDCGHTQADHLNDGPCIHGDGDDGCIAFNEVTRTPHPLPREEK